MSVSQALAPRPVQGPGHHVLSRGPAGRGIRRDLARVPGTADKAQPVRGPQRVSQVPQLRTDPIATSTSPAQSQQPPVWSTTMAAAARGIGWTEADRMPLEAGTCSSTGSVGPDPGPCPGRAAGFRRECLTRPTPRHRHILSSCTSQPTPTHTTPHIQQDSRNGLHQPTTTCPSPPRPVPARHDLSRPAGSGPARCCVSARTWPDRPSSWVDVRDGGLAPRNPVRQPSRMGRQPTRCASRVAYRLGELANRRTTNADRVPGIPVGPVVSPMTYRPSHHPHMKQKYRLNDPNGSRRGRRPGPGGRSGRLGRRGRTG